MANLFKITITRHVTAEKIQDAVEEVIHQLVELTHTHPNDLEGHIDFTWDIVPPRK